MPFLFVLTSMIFWIAMFSIALRMNRAEVNMNMSSRKYDILASVGIWPETFRGMRIMRRIVAMIGIMK